MLVVNGGEIILFCTLMLVVVVVYPQQVFEESSAATEDYQSLPLRNELRGKGGKCRTAKKNTPYIYCVFGIYIYIYMFWPKINLNKNSPKGYCI